MKKVYTQFAHLLVLSVFVLTTLFGSVLPARTVHAQAPGVFVPVLDGPNLVVNTTSATQLTLLNTKENVLDGIMVQIGKQIISHITQSIVNWINNGFEGGPAFVSDPEAFFADVADQVTGTFIDRLGLDYLCGTFALPIQLALHMNFDYGGKVSSGVKRYRCTASAIADNISSGEIVDMDAFFQVAVTTNNNPVGAYLAAQQDLELQILGKRVGLFNELNWGDGFLSQKKDCDANGQNCRIVTPGSLVEDQLVNVFGSGLRQLELADEVNEIVGALANQLINTMINKGLSGISRAGEDLKSFADQLPIDAEAHVDIVVDKNLHTQTVCYRYGPAPEDPSILECIDERPLDIDDTVNQAIDNASQYTPDVPTINVGTLTSNADIEFISQDGSVTVYKIGTNGWQYADFAIDGRNDGTISASREGAMLVFMERDPGLRLDLGRPMLLYELEVYPITAVDSEDDPREVSLDAAFGDKGFVKLYNQHNTLIDTIRVFPKEGQRSFVVDLGEQFAQYVEVVRDGSGTLAIAEVEVDGIDVLGQDVTNLARFPGVQTYFSVAPWNRGDTIFESKAAIDGKTSGDFVVSGVFSAWSARAATSDNPTLTIELSGRVSLIEKILLYPGLYFTQSKSLFFGDYELMVDGQSVATFTIDANSRSPYEISGWGVGADALQGDTVVIKRLGDNVRFELGEVEIYGRLLKQD